MVREVAFLAGLSAQGLKQKNGLKLTNFLGFLLHILWIQAYMIGLLKTSTFYQQKLNITPLILFSTLRQQHKNIIIMLMVN